jgi:hypothetical protein
MATEELFLTIAFVIAPLWKVKNALAGAQFSAYSDRLLIVLPINSAIAPSLIIQLPYP